MKMNHQNCTMDKRSLESHYNKKLLASAGLVFFECNLIFACGQCFVHQKWIGVVICAVGLALSGLLYWTIKKHWDSAYKQENDDPRAGELDIQSPSGAVCAHRPPYDAKIGFFECLDGNRWTCRRCGASIYMHHRFLWAFAYLFCAVLLSLSSTIVIVCFLGVIVLNDSFGIPLLVGGEAILLATHCVRFFFADWIPWRTQP